MSIYLNVIDSFVDNFFDIDSKLILLQEWFSDLPEIFKIILTVAIIVSIIFGVIELTKKIVENSVERFFLIGIVVFVIFTILIFFKN